MSLRKLIITPYFGDLPEWMDKFEPPKGYDWLMDTDLEGFKERVKKTLLIDYPGEYGNPKVWDMRCALGLLYAKELDGYDYWGHMDLDVVWGDMERYLPDEYLSYVHVYSSHHEYVCGCFSMYRNVVPVNYLFMRCPEWREIMSNPTATGWVEQEFSRTLEASGLGYSYNFHQGNPWTDKPILKKEGNRLYQFIESNWEEIMFFHFRHSKRWPL